MELDSGLSSSFCSRSWSESSFTIIWIKSSVSSLHLLQYLGKLWFNWTSFWRWLRITYGTLRQWWRSMFSCRTFLRVPTTFRSFCPLETDLQASFETLALILLFLCSGLLKLVSGRGWIQGVMVSECPRKSFKWHLHTSWWRHFPTSLNLQAFECTQHAERDPWDITH